MSSGKMMAWAAVGALLLSACGGSVGGGAAYGGGDGSAKPTSSPATSPSGNGHGSGGAGYGRGSYGGGSGSGSGRSKGGGQSVLTVKQANYSFRPSTIKVASGDVITLTNTSGSTPHTFTVEGQGIDVTNDAGQSQKVKIDLPPGTYSFFCRFHQSLGMTGTLLVS